MARASSDKMARASGFSGRRLTPIFMKNIATIVAATVLAAPAFSQDFDRLAPKNLPPREPVPAGVKPPPPPLGGGSDAVLLERLKGLVFVPTPAAVQPGGVRGAAGVVVKNIALLESAKFAARMQPYIGAPLTLGALGKIQHEVTAFYTAQDRPLVSISVPAQDITGGVVQIIVQEGMLGEVRVEGNRYFKSPLFRTGVRLREGDAIYKSRLEQDTRGLNANPFRSVDTVFSPGRTPGTTDVVLQVQDRFPLRVYVGYENTGTPETDRNRLLGGFNWGNAFGLGHQLNYQFTTSPDFDRLRAHSASYLVPLPWLHTLAFFGSYAETTPDLPDGFDLNGRTYQVSFRYTMRLPDVKAYTHEIAFGYDFKSSNTDLGFGGARVFDSTIDISQFVLTYNGALPDAYGRTLLNAEVYLSPGGLGEHNEDEDFEAASSGASASYVYGKLTLQRTTRLPADFSLLSSATGQFADGPLYPSEQLGVGGYDTVRGYSERAANGDHGFFMSHELRTPALHPARIFRNEKLTDDLQFLAFWDYGFTKTLEPRDGEDSSQSLASLGIGARYAIGHYLSLRADYGWKLIDLDSDSGDGRFHLGVTASF